MGLLTGFRLKTPGGGYPLLVWLLLLLLLSSLPHRGTLRRDRDIAPYLRGFAPSQKLPRIQNIAGIKRLLDRPMQTLNFRICRLRPPSLFGQTNPMFARDCPAPFQHLLEQIIQWRFGALLRIG